MFPRNMGTADRVIRLVVAILIIGLYQQGMLSGAWTTVLLVVAGAFIVTSFIGTCPLYLPLGIRTRPKA